MPPKPSSCQTPTTNACKLCTPLGACLAFRGFEGCVPFLHGSQGCATYIRRYLISHFREPMDIASSAFSEETVVFGGKRNLHEGLYNVIKQYNPKMIGIATTCLAETIGDDLNMFLHEFKKEFGEAKGLPELIPVSTPAYNGTHAEGFWWAVRSIIDATAKHTETDPKLTALVPGMVSPADLRHLHDILDAFNMSSILLPDYSETLDGGSWDNYQKMPEGGTPLAELHKVGDAGNLISFTSCIPLPARPGVDLKKKYGTELIDMPLPVGIGATDRFFDVLSSISGEPVPKAFEAERARLVDAYVDAHKVTASKKVAVFGDADFVVSMTVFLREIGLIPVVCIAGGRSPRFKEALLEAVPDLPDDVIIRDECDFSDIEEEVTACAPDLLVGSSKGYAMSRRLDIPLMRSGFPVHDRVDGPRMLSVGYRGAQVLFDNICNVLMEHYQDESPVSFSYM